MTAAAPRPVVRSVSRRAAVVAVIAGIAWVVAVLAWAPPYRITCDPAVPRDVCVDTVNAGLGRGMPRFHPVIVGAHVAPGPAFPSGYGHRATVTYDMLPAPSVVVRLFFDAGGHWGAVPSVSSAELALWALVPVVLLVLGGLAWMLVSRRRGARARPTAGAAP